MSTVTKAQTNAAPEVAEADVGLYYACPCPVRSALPEAKRPHKMVFIGNSGAFARLWVRGGMQSYNPLTAWHAQLTVPVDIIPLQLPARLYNSYFTGNDQVVDMEPLDEDGLFKKGMEQIALDWLEEVLRPEIIGDGSEEPCTFSITGTSIGSWCALELSRLLKESHGLEPELLYLSNLPPPNLGWSKSCPFRDQLVRNMDPLELRDFVRAYGANGIDVIWDRFVGQIKPDIGLLDEYSEFTERRFGVEGAIVSFSKKTKVIVAQSQDDWGIPEHLKASAGHRKLYQAAWEKCIPGATFENDVLKGQTHCWLVNDRNKVEEENLIPRFNLMLGLEEKFGLSTKSICSTALNMVDSVWIGLLYRANDVTGIFVGSQLVGRYMTLNNAIPWLMVSHAYCFMSGFFGFPFLRLLLQLLSYSTYCFQFCDVAYDYALNNKLSLLLVAYIGYLHYSKMNQHTPLGVPSQKSGLRDMETLSLDLVNNVHNRTNSYRPTIASHRTPTQQSLRSLSTSVSMDLIPVKPEQKTSDEKKKISHSRSRRAKGCAKLRSCEAPTSQSMEFSVEESTEGSPHLSSRSRRESTAAKGTRLQELTTSVTNGKTDQYEFQ